MTASIWPGSVARAAGAVTCASTLPTATAMPSGSPVQAAASAVSPPARSPSWPIGCSSLSATKSSNAGVQRGEVVARGVLPVLVDALVAGGAGVADVAAAQLPDDPVGRLDPAVGGRVDLRVLLQQLQRLGELPLAGDAAAVAGQPGLTARLRQLVDPVGLRLGCVVLPELEVGVRAVAEPPSSHSGVPSASVGSTVHAVKSVPIPMTSAGSTPLAARASGTAVAAPRPSPTGPAGPSPVEAPPPWPAASGPRPRAGRRAPRSPVPRRRRPARRRRGRRACRNRSRPRIGRHLTRESPGDVSAHGLPGC